MNGQTLRILAGAVALTTLVGAVGALNGLGSADLPSWAQLRLAAGQDARADERLRGATGPAALDEARRLSRLALRDAPYDTGALLRLAYIDRARNGALTAEGLSALQQSYDRIALDPATGLWRIPFALENWASLPVPLRLRVQEEALALISEPGHRWPLRSRLGEVRNPQGAVVARLWDRRAARALDEARRGALPPASGPN
jgi:hypothetical protein